jgi:hypothetical protein
MVIDLLERADTLRTERNELIHGVWDTTNSTANHEQP